eukprot:6058702-Amphidinium_carterae.1
MSEVPSPPRFEGWEHPRNLKKSNGGLACELCGHALGSPEHQLKIILDARGGNSSSVTPAGGIVLHKSRGAWQQC